MRFPLMLSMFWSMSVDFPIPGSPPIRVREPATRPPPSARLSYSLGICMRGSSSACISLRGTGLESAETRVPRVALPVPLETLTFSPTKVFHSPQLGHLPTHLGDSCPQLLQKYAVFTFAIFTSF